MTYLALPDELEIAHEVDRGESSVVRLHGAAGLVLIAVLIVRDLRARWGVDRRRTALDTATP